MTDAVFGHQSRVDQDESLHQVWRHPTRTGRVRDVRRAPETDRRGWTLGTTIASVITPEMIIVELISQ